MNFIKSNIYWIIIEILFIFIIYITPGPDTQLGTASSAGVQVDGENVETTVDPDRYSPFFYLWILCSIASSLYAYTWDIKMDWGLLDRLVHKPRNFWFRSKSIWGSVPQYMNHDLLIFKL